MWRVVVAAVALAGCQQIFGLQQPQVSMPGDGNTDGGGSGSLRIGGSVNGLTGTGLVLENNGADDDPIANNGAFVFPSLVASGSPYDVTVSTAPTNPSQTCTVANGTGTATADVTDVGVTCAVSSFSVGGTVSGLNAGTSVTLKNGVDTLAVSPNGVFTFPTPVASGSPYLVTVVTQPASGGPCNVFGGAGTIGNANVTSVTVNCSATLFTVGGTVTGLNGSVHVRNNTNGDTVTISANGSYAFPMTVSGAYNVTVTTQPAYPPASQACTVANGTGTATANVTNINVACTTNHFTVGGTVTGLTGGTLVLQNNGGDDKTISANGTFTFATSIASGNTYSVSVKTQPGGLFCAATSGSGTVANSNVTNVSVTCTDPGVRCGATYCGSPEVCCDPTGTAHCQSAMVSCATLALPCDDVADCGVNQVCCADLNASRTKVNKMQCEAAGQCGGNNVFMCNPSAPSCLGGTTCQPLGALPGYYACQ